jgi:EAL domain-containing protein (putative c-di-GMP-specific phosphodiesterase class I)
MVNGFLGDLKNYVDELDDWNIALFNRILLSYASIHTPSLTCNLFPSLLLADSLFQILAQRLTHTGMHARRVIAINQNH